MICVVHAHPYPSRSRVNRALADALSTLSDVDLRTLYALYPDFDIDVAAEQKALARAELVVWMHPLYWYSVPSLLKHWMDKVLEFGWAYGDGAGALAGKSCLWVPTAGGSAAAFTPDGLHAHPFASFVPPIEQTARFCGMRWEPPHVVLEADDVDATRLSDIVTGTLQRLEGWRAPVRATGEIPP
ncbi:MAG TPA: NAD(P)H-dependent oxidoreductase [Casimicrobiaceae bacterium]|nr:NAD(P)H-dependent oxidoreductase [Casimicrobiaceae bacterium]